MSKTNKTIHDLNLESEDSSSDYNPDEKVDSESSDSESSDSDSSDSDSSDSDSDIKEKKISTVSKKDNDNESDNESDMDFDVPDDIKIKVEDNEESDPDFDVPDIDFEKKEQKTKSTAPEKIPLILRKSFPFCFWYFTHLDDDVDMLKNTTINIIQKLLDIEEVDVYIIKGNKEKDRLRIVCPDVFVDAQTAKDIRSLILRDMGYKVISNIIPALMYEVPVTPNILMSRVWDIGLGKWESYQTYSCFNHKDLKTEQLEKLLDLWSKHDKEQKASEFTDEYKEYLTVRENENGGNSSVLDDEELVSVSIGDKEISEEMKKEADGNLDKCIEWFKKYHPDSGLRLIKKLGDNKSGGSVFFLDFTKSKHKCRLCNLVHLSNRQYLTYSNKSKKAFYHCYDNDADGKKHVLSFKKQKKASNVVSAI